MRPMEISTTLADRSRSTTPAWRRSWRTRASAPTSPTTCSPSSGRPTRGWHDARVTPYGPLTLDPATAVLHYAQEIFEGMKAYRHDDGSDLDVPPRGQRRADGALQPAPRAARAAGRPTSCRPSRRWSTRRPALGARAGGREEPLPAAVHVRHRGVPRRAARPARHLHGDRQPGRRLLQPRARKPVTLWLTTDYTRAGRGGMGAAKTGGNYASSLVAQQEATAQGCDQVVFLDAQELQYVEELGGMNMYFVYADGRIVTPALGTILEGITRVQHHRAGRQAGPPGRGAPDLHRRVARRRAPAARSPRSSPAAPRPSSPRSAR